MNISQKAENSIIKKYKKTIWNKFIGGLKDYKLISKGDKIAVCISGGKDSMILAKCMQHLQKYSEVEFDLKYIVMDPGYNKENLDRIKENANKLEIPIEIFKSDIFNVVEWGKGSPCYLCARMRRGYLYKFANQVGCNKIALGHHFDDVIETILMSMLYGAEVKTMMPKLHSENYEGMELIRPLYLVRESDIISWSRYNELEFIRCGCNFTKDEDTQENSKRAEIKNLLSELRKTSKYIDMNIFRSVENISLTTIIGYKTSQSEEKHSFLDDYDKSEKK